jgi:hypothetical protein
VAAIAPDLRWDFPLRLLGGLHYLVLTGRASWDDVRGALAGEAEFLRHFTAEQGIQTNEVRRSWILAPCFLLLAEETGAEAFDLVELGAGAGFNLLWDRYHHVYEAGEWGSQDAALSFEGEERGPVPGRLFGRRPTVRRRIGIDLNPLDVTRAEDALLLRSFVWADQRERLDVLDRAIAAVRRSPPELVHGDYVERLPELLAERRSGALTVVFQTASLGYVTAEERRRVRETLTKAAESEPLAWIGSAAPLEEGMTAWGMDVRLLPGERRIVAHADFHGAWIDWFPEPA